MQSAISQLEAATDGEGGTTEDLQAASKALAAGTAQMKAALDNVVISVDNTIKVADQAFPEISNN